MWIWVCATDDDDDDYFCTPECVLVKVAYLLISIDTAVIYLVLRIVKSINTDVPLTSVDFHHNGSTLAVGSSTGLFSCL